MPHDAHTMPEVRIKQPQSHASRISSWRTKKNVLISCAGLNSTPSSRSLFKDDHTNLLVWSSPIFAWIPIIYLDSRLTHPR